jgi:PhzF family phenazine biosynthesis protein
MREGNRKNGIPIYLVDAFTNEPFRGNPAAVCPMNGPMNESTMQAVAAEMNLSETAFLHSTEKLPLEESVKFSLRWFTPEIEVPLCGHATLASAAVLFNEICVFGNGIVFDTKSGELHAKKEGDEIVLDFPIDEPKPIEAPKKLLKAMGITTFEKTFFSEKRKCLLVHMEDEESVRQVEPDFEQMKKMPLDDGIIGVIVTSPGNPPFDFISRFFGPWVGVNEDPVTGSAHTVLGPYWSKILGKKEMRAHQASRRGGELTLRIEKDDRIHLIGSAVIVSKGELFI